MCIRDKSYKRILTLILAGAVTILPVFAFGAGFIVQDGHPCAEIIIAEEPPRTTRLAAQELQAYVEKITGATLPITNAPASDVPVKIYIGRSTHTDQLGLSNEDLNLRRVDWRLALPLCSMPFALRKNIKL